MVLAAELAGCAKYEPQPLDPQVELTALRHRTIPDVTIHHSATAATTRPFDPSDGLDEDEVVSVALTLNPSLSAKRLELGQSQAELISAGVWPNPEVGLDWRTGISGTSGTVLEADLLFELLSPKRRELRQAAANAQIAQTQAEIVAHELSLAGEVRRQHLQVLSASLSAGLLGEELRLRRRGLDLMQQRKNLGEATELDVTLAELELAHVSHDLRRAEADVASARRKLNELMGLPATYDLRLSLAGRPLAVRTIELPADEQLDQRLIAWHPQLQALQAAHEQAEHDLRLAILQQFPNLRVGPSFGRELEGDQSLGLGLGLELPIWDRNQGEIASRRNAREQARARYVSLMHELRAEAHDAAAELARVRAELEVHRNQLSPLLERSQALFERALRARELGVLPWLELQQQLMRARRNLLETAVDYHVALIRLETVAGKL